MEKQNTRLLKDQLFNRFVVENVADCILKVYPSFSRNEFIDEIINGFSRRELKERMSWMREMIEKYLPNDYKTTLRILVDSLKHAEKIGGFTFSSYADYVMVNGCDSDYLELSLNAIGDITKYFSGEFAIRAFINDFPDQTFEKMYEWSKSKDVEQRRLSCEGLRPKLPWAKSITFDYKKGARILENLYFDNERYVTRSVANHLNDISKIDPDFVVKTLDRWQKSNKQNVKEMSYIIHHSLRTSIKKGHIKSFEFLGYNHQPNITIHDLKIKNTTLSLGDYLEFLFSIKAYSDEKLIIDYKIIYPMMRNKTSQKVFKIKKVSLKCKEMIRINKRHKFKSMTTKKLYSGNYKLVVQINGKTYDTLEFKLNVN